MKQLLITFKKKEMFILGNFKSNGWLEKKKLSQNNICFIFIFSIFRLHFFPKINFRLFTEKEKNQIKLYNRDPSIY